jgi:hypothetical protein
MTNTKTNKTKLVTLNVTGNWRPTTDDTGKTAEFTAVRACYVVDSFTVVSDEDVRCVTFSGTWETEAEARRFASSCGDARVRYATPYWYVPGFGRVGHLSYAETIAA